MNSPLVSVAALRSAIGAASHGLIERGAIVETIALAAVAGEHVLVIGPPGTAKSEAARRIAATLGGRYFEYLLGRFTEPGEIFGPVDLVKLREGQVETRVEGMLPEADFAFLDEIFLGSTAILNTLLGILNERTFRRGHTALKCPLRAAIGAANALPTDPSLEAFADRFLLRVYLDAVPDQRLEELLEGGWNASSTPSQLAETTPRLVDPPAAMTSQQAEVPSHFPDAPQSADLLFQASESASQRLETPISSPEMTSQLAEMAPPRAGLHDIDTLSKLAQNCDLGAVRPALAAAIRTLRGAGISLSDRRAVRVQKLVAAAAALDGRAVASEADLWPLILAVPTREDQARARELLREMLAKTSNAALLLAAEEASSGPAARANRLLDAARGLLSAPLDEAAWRLKLEGVAREMDAAFSPEKRPAALGEVREQIAAALESGVTLVAVP